MSHHPFLTGRAKAEAILAGRAFSPHKAPTAKPQQSKPPIMHGTASLNAPWLSDVNDREARWQERIDRAYATIAMIGL